MELHESQGELHESQGDQMNSQPEEHVHCLSVEGTTNTIARESHDEFSEQCENSGLDEKIGDSQSIETGEYLEPLSTEVPCCCNDIVISAEHDTPVVMQDLVSDSELSPLPNASLCSSDHSEMFADIIKTVHEMKCSNGNLKISLEENCRLITDLEAKCASLEKKNECLEKFVAKLIETGDCSATSLALLSTEVASLISLKTSDATRSDENVANTTGSDSDKPESSVLVALSNVEKKIADLELVTVESSTRLKEMAVSVDHIERDLQRFIRRHSIIVENLCPKEDRSAQEAFLVFVNCVLHVTADESDIDGLHLIDKQSTDASAGGATGSPNKTANDHVPRAVLVTFTCYRTRMKVYKAWLSYRVGASGDAKAGVGALSGERGQGVCIREYLTAAQELIYRAAMDARHRKPDLITDCWTFRGRAFVRTCHGDVREFSEVDQMITKNDSKYRSCSVM